MNTLSQVPLYLVEALGYAGLITVAIVLVLRGDNLGQVLPVLGLYGFAAYRLLPASQIIYRSAARMRFGSSAPQNIHRDLMFRTTGPGESPRAPRKTKFDGQALPEPCRRAFLSAA